MWGFVSELIKHPQKRWILETVDGNETISRTLVFGYKRFGRELEDLDDGRRSVWPLPARNPETVAKVREPLGRNCRIALLLSIKGTLTGRIFIRFFVKRWERGRSVRSVPHSLTVDQ